jgi:hypothetical protein
MARDRSKDSPLFKIVDLTSGSSWDGTHDRSIHVTYVDDNNITVQNEYCGSGPKDVFTLIQIADELADEHFHEARYFSDFCYEIGQNVPGAQTVKSSESQWYYSGVLLPATPMIVDREMKAGAGDNVAAFKPLTLGSAPKPFALKLKK